MLTSRRSFIVLCAAWIGASCGPRSYGQLRSELAPGTRRAAIGVRFLHDAMAGTTPGFSVTFKQMKYSTSANYTRAPSEYEAAAPEVVAGLEDALPEADVALTDNPQDPRLSLIAEVYVSGIIEEHTPNDQIDKPPFTYTAKAALMLRFRKPSEQVGISYAEERLSMATGQPSPSSDKRLSEQDAFRVANTAALAPGLVATARAKTAEFVRTVLASKQ